MIIFFILAIGPDPKGMTVAVVNEEVGGGGCLTWSDSCLLARDLSLQEEEEDEWSDWDVSKGEAHLNPSSKVGTQCSRELPIPFFYLFEEIQI